MALPSMNRPESGVWIGLKLSARFNTGFAIGRGQQKKYGSH
jgi:hypothetical protein